MRSTWTDERLDDLRDEVHGMRAEANARFDAMEQRFDAMQRLLIQVGGGIIATLLAGYAALLATQL